MKWFNRWLYGKIRWAWTRAEIEHPDWKRQEDLLDGLSEQELWPGNANEIDRSSLYETSLGEIDPHGLNDGMRIDIKHMVGGYVVSITRAVDNSKNSNYREPERTSYIITDDQDFDTELCKILSMERLKQ